MLISYRLLGQIHENVLRMGIPAPFNRLYEMQQYATSLVLSQPQDAKVYLDPEMEWVCISGERMYFEQFRSGVAALLEQIEERFSNLTKDCKCLPCVPEDLSENISDASRGYCFLDEEHFTKSQHTLFHFLVQKHNLVTTDSENKIHWDVPRVKHILQLLEGIWSRMYYLLYLTTPIASRGTQFLTHQIRNAERLRTIFVQGEEVYFVTRYSKTTNIKGRDSCIPAFLPKPVARLFLKLLGGGLRETEALLAGVVYGSDATQIYRT